MSLPREESLVSVGASDEGHNKSYPLLPLVPAAKCLILPRSKQKIIWDICNTVLIVYVVVFTPIRVGMDVPAMGVPFVWELLVDAFFIADLLGNFFAAADDPNNPALLYSHKAIACRYLSGWFIVDLVASFPTDICVRVATGQFMCSLTNNCPQVTSAGASWFKMMRILRLSRLSRVLRLLRLRRLLREHYEELFFFVRFLPLGKTLVMLLVIAHMLACFFYFFSSPMFWTSREQKLIDAKLLRPFLLDQFGDDPTEISVAQRYLTCLYWSLSTMTTVGYGDISAKTVAERCYAVFALLIGAGYFSYVIGNVSMLLSHLNRQRQTAEERMDRIRSFCAEANLPKDIRRALLGFCNMNVNVGQSYNPRELLQDMPFNIRKAVFEHLYSDIIAKIPLFQAFPEGCRTEICQRLVIRYFAKDSVICERGSIGAEMYIVVKGELEIAELKLKQGDTVPRLKEGDYFGEGALLGKSKRTATIRASDDCTLCVITAEDMNYILRGYPEVIKQIEGDYERRKKATAKTIQKKVKDEADPNNNFTCEQSSEPNSEPPPHLIVPSTSILVDSQLLPNVPTPEPQTQPQQGSFNTDAGGEQQQETGRKSTVEPGIGLLPTNNNNNPLQPAQIVCPTESLTRIEDDILGGTDRFSTSTLLQPSSPPIIYHQVNDPPGDCVQLSGIEARHPSFSLADETSIVPPEDSDGSLQRTDTKVQWSSRIIGESVSMSSMAEHPSTTMGAIMHTAPSAVVQQATTVHMHNVTTGAISTVQSVEVLQELSSLKGMMVDNYERMSKIEDKLDFLSNYFMQHMYNNNRQSSINNGTEEESLGGLGSPSGCYQASSSSVTAPASPLSSSQRKSSRRRKEKARKCEGESSSKRQEYNPDNGGREKYNPLSGRNKSS